MQKYFIVSGTQIRNSLQILKKWSIPVLLVKIVAEKSRILIFCWRKSFDETPSTWTKGLKSTLRLYFFARSKYGDFGLLGSGCDTRIFFIFNLLPIKFYFSGASSHYLSKPVKYFTIIRTGKISSAQRYKIKYKTEIFLFIKIKNILNMRIK